MSEITNKSIHFLNILIKKLEACEVSPELIILYKEHASPTYTTITPTGMTYEIFAGIIDRIKSDRQSFETYRQENIDIKPIDWRKVSIYLNKEYSQLMRMHSSTFYQDPAEKLQMKSNARLIYILSQALLAGLELPPIQSQTHE